MEGKGAGYRRLFQTAGADPGPLSLILVPHRCALPAAGDNDIVILVLEKAVYVH